MTKNEAAIITAYTGVLIGSFSDAHEYIEKVMNRPVWTHEMANEDFMNKLREASKADFLSISPKGE